MAHRIGAPRLGLRLPPSMAAAFAAALAASAPAREALGTPRLGLPRDEMSVRYVDHATPQIRELERAIGQLDGGVVIRVDLPADEAVKLENLQKTGRDLTAMSPRLRHDLVRAFRAAVQRNAGLPRAMLSALATSLGEVAREELRRRFAGDTQGLRLTPLKPETVRRKGHARIGVDSGDLRDAVAGARIRVETR